MISNYFLIMNVYNLVNLYLQTYIFSCIYNLNIQKHLITSCFMISWTRLPWTYAAVLYLIVYNTLYLVVLQLWNIAFLHSPRLQNCSFSRVSFIMLRYPVEWEILQSSKSCFKHFRFRSTVFAWFFGTGHRPKDSDNRINEHT